MSTISPKTRRLARSLRREPTEPELLLWQHLRGNRLGGHRFRRQHPVGAYVLDFYCPTLRLAIEVDGSGHLDTVPHDEARTEVLATAGIRLLRFWNHEVSNETDRVLQEIFAEAQALSTSPWCSRPPPPPLRGTSPSKEGED